MLVFFGSLELAASFWLSHDRLDRILSVLRRDATLIWSMRPALDVEFFGAHISTDTHGFRQNRDQGQNAENSAPTKPFTILTLGASPSFGWGVANDETYSSQLEVALNKNSSSSRFKIWNGSMIGFSSTQGLKLFKKIAPDIKPDLILVSYVINDVDSFRFFFDNGTADKLLELPAAWVVETSNFLERFQFVRAMNSILAALLRPQAPLNIGACASMIERGPRVSADEYRKNLIEFIRIARQRGIGIVFLKMPVNLPRGPEPSDPAIALRNLDLAVAKLRANGCAQALPLALSAWKLDPLSKRTNCYLAACLQEMGENDRSAIYRNLLAKIDTHQASRRAAVYNEILSEVAKENSVDVVDIVEAFSEVKDSYLFVDPKLDPIHPNKEGHKLIASKVKKYIVTAWPNWKVNP